jgi:hypothetical protein
VVVVVVGATVVVEATTTDVEGLVVGAAVVVVVVELVVVVVELTCVEQAPVTSSRPNRANRNGLRCKSDLQGTFEGCLKEPNSFGRPNSIRKIN